AGTAAVRHGRTAVRAHRSRQERGWQVSPRRFGYLGPEATFTEAALLKYLDSQGLRDTASTQPMRNAPSALDAVAEGDCDAARSAGTAAVRHGRTAVRAHRSRQERGWQVSPRRFGYLGPEATFTEAALLKYLDSQGLRDTASTQPMRNAPSALDAVAEGDCDAAEIGRAH